MKGEREESDRPTGTVYLDATLIMCMILGFSMAFSESVLSIYRMAAEVYATFRPFCSLSHSR